MLGWRHGNPDTDVDLDGSPVERNYITLVRISDCPLVDENGRRYYEPKGVAQAFPIAHGGTYYGYGKCQVVRNGRGRWITTYEDGKPKQEFTCTYVKTPYYVVKDGRVYVGACYRHYDESAKKLIAKQRAA